MNVTLANAPSGADKPLIKSQIVLENRLKEALSQKEATEISIHSHQHELEKFYDKKAGKILKESIDDIDKDIAKLEFQRNMSSMSIAEERDILKQLHKLTDSRQKITENLRREQQIKEKRAVVISLKDSLKENRHEISELKKEISTFRTAAALGCEVDDIVVKHIDCPHEKIGKILGKKGKNIRELMSSNHVEVKIDKNRGDIRLTGRTLESLEAATTKITETIEQTEDRIELSCMMQKYLTSANILLSVQLQTNHPNVSFKIFKRKDISLSDSSTGGLVHVCGLAADVTSFKEELRSWECVSTSLPILTRDVGLLLGKAGRNVANLVKLHQVIIEIHRTSKVDHSSESSTDLSAVVTVFGPCENVEEAKSAIFAMIETNKEFEELVPLDTIVKSVLLLNNGAYLEALQISVNKALSEIGNSRNNTVVIRIRNSDLVVKGKIDLLQCSMKLVREEIQRICSGIVKINVDPFTIPVIIGKGGQGIKNLKEGTTSVFLNVDRTLNLLEIVGLDKAEVDKVVEAVTNLVNCHQVKRLQIDYEETKTTKTFSKQYKRLVFSPTMKKLKDLVFVMDDVEKKEIVLRGKPENLVTSEKIIHEFFEVNFVDEIIVAEECMASLLEGGSICKLAKIAKLFRVNLSCDKNRALIVAKGNKDDVLLSIKSIEEFLFGNEDYSVLKIKAVNKAVLGIVIGKAGKKKAELEDKYPLVSIQINGLNSEIIVRGAPKEAEECRQDITNILSKAKLT